MNLNQFFLILRARWRLVAIGALIVFNIALAWVLFAPAHYLATAQVLVDVRAPATINVAGDPGVTPQLSPDYVSTQVDVIRSKRVAIGAVRKLGILNDPVAMENFRDSDTRVDPETYFADKLVRDLQIIPSVSSRVISIAYSGRTPASAAAVANAFADSYKEMSVELLREAARNEAHDYKQSIDEMGAKLTAAENELNTIRIKYGITASGPDGVDSEEGRLNALSAQMAMSQANQAAQNQRSAGGALPDALQNPVIQTIQNEIAKVEAQRQQLATFAGPNNPDVQQLNNRLSALRSQMAQQRAVISSGASASSAQANANVAAMQRAIAEQRARLLEKQKARGGIMAMEQNVQNLKTTYEALVAKQLQSTVLGASDQSNIVVLSRAPLPTSPSGLPAALRLLAGALLGALLGAVLAIFVELLDQRLRRSEDVEVWLGIPDLGVIRRPALAGPPQRLLPGVVTRYLPGPSDRNSE